jgi:hypothetical protein
MVLTKSKCTVIKGSGDEQEVVNCAGYACMSPDGYDTLLNFLDDVSEYCR